ncbi:MAG: hypothetical protein OEM50_03010 [Gammaproteobacteria bacterium]|nr:hypothetical protein [Gammaproteobacteria bacterium]
MIRNAKRSSQWVSSSVAARTVHAFLVGLVFVVLLVVPNTCTNAAEPSLDDALVASPNREDMLNCVVELLSLEAAPSSAGGNE